MRDFDHSDKVSISIQKADNQQDRQTAEFREEASDHKGRPVERVSEGDPMKRQTKALHSLTFHVRSVKKPVGFRKIETSKETPVHEARLKRSIVEMKAEEITSPTPWQFL